jgi:hypothetical protein
VDLRREYKHRHPLIILETRFPIFSIKSINSTNTSDLTWNRWKRRMRNEPESSHYKQSVHSFNNESYVNDENKGSNTSPFLNNSCCVYFVPPPSAAPAWLFYFLPISYNRMKPEEFIDFDIRRYDFTCNSNTHPYNPDPVFPSSSPELNSTSSIITPSPLFSQFSSSLSSTDLFSQNSPQLYHNSSEDLLGENNYLSTLVNFFCPSSKTDLIIDYNSSSLETLCTLHPNASSLLTPSNISKNSVLGSHNNSFNNNYETDISAHISSSFPQHFHLQHSLLQKFLLNMPVYRLLPPLYLAIGVYNDGLVIYEIFRQNCEKNCDECKEKNINSNKKSLLTFNRSLKSYYFFFFLFNLI